MKIRTGFVSNSSSSSFIIGTDKEDIIVADLVNALRTSKINTDNLLEYLARAILYESQRREARNWLKDCFGPEYDGVLKRKHVYSFEIPGGGDGGSQMQNFIKDFIRVDYKDDDMNIIHTGHF